MRRAVFAILTAATLLYAGMWHWALWRSAQDEAIPMWTWDTALHGLWYALPLATILLCHEAGHLLACRVYRLPTTGPYFLPSPFALVGTAGAFIRVHALYPTRKALIHVGLAGPLFGLLPLVPCLIAGVWLSQDAAPVVTNVVRFGEPWLLGEWEHFLLGPGPHYLHPLAIAAWIGLLFTMLNLIPFRQFDGGHIVRGAFGERVGLWCSVVTFVGAIFLAYHSVTWALIAVIMALDWHAIEKPIENETPNFRWAYVLVAAGLFALCWNQIDVRR